MWLHVHAHCCMCSRISVSTSHSEHMPMPPWHTCTPGGGGGPVIRPPPPWGPCGPPSIAARQHSSICIVAERRGSSPRPRTRRRWKRRSQHRPPRCSRKTTQENLEKLFDFYFIFPIETQSISVKKCITMRGHGFFSIHTAMLRDFPPVLLFRSLLFSVLILAKFLRAHFCISRGQSSIFLPPQSIFAVSAGCVVCWWGGGAWWGFRIGRDVRNWRVPIERVARGMASRGHRQPETGDAGLEVEHVRGDGRWFQVDV